jgi:thymidylate kinase
LIVEFIGTTGAGKTTLITQVHQRLAALTATSTAYEQVAGPLGLGGIRNSSLRNLVQELIGFPFFLSSAWRQQAFISFALKMLARQARFSLFTVNNLRSLERKLGVYEILRRGRGDRVVLVDEGTLLLAHNIFVFSSAVYTGRELDRFAGLVPLPDAVVYVHAPVETLVRRTLQRSDPPREMRARDPDLAARQIQRARQVFEQLARSPRISSRLFPAENCDSDGPGRERLADEIVEFILDVQRRSQRV